MKEQVQIPQCLSSNIRLNLDQRAIRSAPASDGTDERGQQFDVYWAEPFLPQGFGLIAPFN